MKLRNLFVTMLTAFALAFSAMAGAASQELAAESVLEEVKKRGSLRVGMSPLYLGRCETRKVT